MRLSGLSRFFAKSFLGAGIFGKASWEEAISNMEKAVELDPGRIYHRLELAEIYADRKRYAGGEKPARRRWRRSPTASSWTPEYRQAGRRRWRRRSPTGSSPDLLEHVARRSAARSSPSSSRRRRRASSRRARSPARSRPSSASSRSRLQPALELAPGSFAPLRGVQQRDAGAQERPEHHPHGEAGEAAAAPARGPRPRPRTSLVSRHRRILGRGWHRSCPATYRSRGESSTIATPQTFDGAGCSLLHCFRR